MSITLAFDSDSCCRSIASAWEYNLATSYDGMADVINSLLLQAYGGEVFGNIEQSQYVYDRLNDLHYLNGLLLIIYSIRQQDINRDIYIDEIEGEDEGNAYYIEEYNLECIKKHFQCYGINTNPVFSAWGYDFTIPRDDDGGVGSTYITGPIGYDGRGFKVS